MCGEEECGGVGGVVWNGICGAERGGIRDGNGMGTWWGEREWMGGADEWLAKAGWCSKHPTANSQTHAASFWSTQIAGLLACIRHTYDCGRRCGGRVGAGCYLEVAVHLLVHHKARVAAGPHTPGVVVHDVRQHNLTRRRHAKLYLRAAHPVAAGKGQRMRVRETGGVGRE